MIVTPGNPRWRIGELAGELGLNPKTIRYYEAIGLLPAPARTATGYRLYGTADRERLRFIGKAKAIGLTLAEIGEVLTLRDDGTCPCPHVLGLLDRKLAAVDAQLRLLSDVRPGGWAG
ncbi:MAG: heavy metal-responsive transcriptional regulator [Actinomycetota bacterium]|nr:heavy metal-responsive transcriptional regulator [Actinomycetota bacterium]